MDPFQGLASLVLGKLKDSAIALWLKLLFQLLVSMVGSFLLIFAATIAAMVGMVLSGKAHLDAGIIFVAALGAGSGASALVLVNQIRSNQSKILKGMRFIFPSLEAAQALATDFETITIADKEQKSS